MLRRTCGSLAVALALLAGSVSIGGCTCKHDGAGEARAGHGAGPTAAARPVRVPLVTPVRTLVPADAQDPASQTVVAHLYERLYELDGRGAVVPSLAAGMPAFDEGVARIALRSDHRFAGPGSSCEERAVTGADVEASLHNLLDPAAANHPLLAGRFAGDDPISVEREGDGETLVLRLAYPQPELAAVLASVGTSVVPHDCDALERLPFGSGPYALGEGSELPRVAALSPKDGSGAPLVFEHVGNAQTALTMFNADELDLYAPAQDQFGQVFDGETLRATATPDGTEVMRVSVAQTNLLLFAQTPDTPRDRAIRTAVCLAFDSERYQTALRNGGSWAEPATSLVPPALADTPDTVGPCTGPRDVEAAKAALEAAGIETPLTLRYATTTGTVAKREADLLVAALAEAGIELEVSQSDAYLYDLATGQSTAELFALGLTADYPDPRAILQAFTCHGDLAPFTHYCNEAFDARLQALAAAGPLDVQAVAELEAMLAADRVARAIDHPQVWYLLAPGLRGVVRHPTGPLRLSHAHRPL